MTTIVVAFFFGFVAGKKAMLACFRCLLVFDYIATKMVTTTSYRRLILFCFVTMKKAMVAATVAFFVVTKSM
jgi:hypothetical protein